MPWYPDILKDSEFREEISQEESPLSPAYPLAGKSLGPARVAGRLVRYAMEAPKELGRIWDRAKEGKATLGDSISAAMYGLAPSRGPGLGAGPRMRAAPWQSRTLDFVLGNPGPWKKPPEAASPQTWLSKAKGAGLPKEEAQILTPFLESADPKSKLTGRQIAEGIEGKGPGTLPTLGVTKTELGGAEYFKADRRLTDISKELSTLQSLSKEQIDKLGVDKIKDRKKQLLEEHSSLAKYIGRDPKWPQFQLEGVENPREILYHAKSKEGGDYINSDMRMHFGEKGKNLAWFQQEGDLKMPDGKMSNHISGLQNDWAAAKAKQESLMKYVEKEPQERERWKDNLPPYKRVIPEPPMKDTWWKTGLKDAVKRAVEEGKDYLSWDTAAIQSKRFPDPKEGTHKYFQQHYDENIPKFLAKEYGVKPEKVNITTKVQDPFLIDLDKEAGNFIEKNQEVWRIPITEEMKRKIVLEGQYFTKQTAKPGGRNAEMAA